MKGLHTLVLWDVLEGLADDGQRYTTLRHATLGLAIELWHDSMGAFHLYLPSDQRNAASAVMCCFSSGIVMQEDTVCAPELLLELILDSILDSIQIVHRPRRHFFSKTFGGFGQHLIF
jgi:hypothetical protein